MNNEQLADYIEYKTIFTQYPLIQEMVSRFRQLDCEIEALKARLCEFEAKPVISATATSIRW